MLANSSLQKFLSDMELPANEALLVTGGKSETDTANNCLCPSNNCKCNLKDCIVTNNGGKICGL